MMRRHIGKLRLMVLLGVAGPLTTATAATVPARAGHGWPNMFDTCFTIDNAGVTNHCFDSSSRKLIVPVQTVATGAITVSAMASGDGSFRVTTCHARSVGLENQVVAMTSPVHTTASGSPQKIILGALSVSAGHTLHVECDIQSGASLINIEFH